PAPIAKVRRWPMRSLTAPHSSVVTAKAMLKPLTTHCRAKGSEPRSREISGRAMAVPAMAIGVTNWAASTTGRVARLGGVSAGPTAEPGTGSAALPVSVVMSAEDMNLPGAVGGQGSVDAATDVVTTRY